MPPPGGGGTAIPALVVDMSWPLPLPDPTLRNPCWSPSDGQDITESRVYQAVAKVCTIVGVDAEREVDGGVNWVLLEIGKNQGDPAHAVVAVPRCPMSRPRSLTRASCRPEGTTGLNSRSSRRRDRSASNCWCTESGERPHALTARRARASAINTAMMAMTTSSSISVKPRELVG